ncbi:MAG: DNA primase [Actinomycetota bacterium]|nr:DNA primase [Actinomycetota bacterium]
MRISQGSIEEVREGANIVEVASEFTALKRQGTNLIGLCPYPDHPEKTPSFSVSPEKGFCYCFGCGRGGDAIKLVMELKSFSFVEAVSHLAERFGVELKFEGRSAEEEKKAGQRAARRRSARKALAAATAYYHKYLLRSPAAEEARRYLKGRGLEQSTIGEFRLGYAPPRGRSGFMRAAHKVGLGREALEAAGLLSTRGGERFVDRVTFPISDKRGRVVGFGARSLGDARPKYLNSPETDIFNKRTLLYGFPQVAEAIRKQRAVLVVEGYTDVLMLYQSGIKNAVATLGTAMTEQHLKSLSSHADVVYLLFDPDEAGEKAVEKATVAAADLKLDLRVLRLTEDPADWLLKHPPQEFADLLERAVPILEYTIGRITDRTWGADVATRARSLEEIKGLIEELDDSVAYFEAIRLASNSLNIDPQALREQLQPAKTRVKSSLGALQSPSARELSPLQEAGQEVLAHILARPDLGASALTEGVEVPGLLDEPLVLGPGDFGDEAQARIFALLSEHAGKALAAVLSDERARDLMDEISALQAAAQRLYPSEASLRAAWFRLGALSRERAKATTEDFDEKSQLHAEMKQLRAAAAEAGNLALES